MINLLPELEKNELALKEKNRIVMILGTVVLFSFICLTMAMFSIRIFLSGEKLVKSEKLDEISENYKYENFLETEKEINTYNRNFEKFKLFYAGQVNISELFKSLLKVDFPKGVYFLDISVDRKADNSLQVNVYGFSSTRSDLLEFRAELEKNSDIKNPVFSPESWTKSEKLNFYLTFGYENKN